MENLQKGYVQDYLNSENLSAEVRTVLRGLGDLLLKVCASQGTPCEAIPSGAGHDSAMFANAGIPSAMIFVRNQNGSHNPAEAMDLDDFMLGAAALDQAIHEIR